MKKRLVLLCVLILFCCTTASASGMTEKYDEALNLIMQKQYREAAAILDEISIYNDASQLSIYCKSIAEGTEGNYSVAYMMLDALGDYKDAKLWSIYFKATEAQESGDSILAYNLFSSIALFQDASEKMKQVETGKNGDFKKEYTLESTSIDEGLIILKKDDKAVYADVFGNIVLDPNVIEASPFIDGLAIVKYQSLMTYVIDRQGKNVIHSYYHGLMRDGDYFITLEYDYSAGKMVQGLIDKTGNVIIEPKYDRVDVLTSNIIAVQKGDKCGLCNMQGKEILNAQFDSFHAISNSLIVRKKGDNYTLLDASGNRISSATYSKVGSENDGLISVEANGKTGFINLDGDVIIDLIYDSAYSFSDEMARVQKDGLWGFVDKNGNTIIPCTYEDIKPFSNNRANVQKNGHWGVIDLQNNVLVPFEYEQLGNYSEGLIPAMKDGKYGYIDEAGNTILEYKWAYAYPFTDGKSYVKDEEGEYYTITSDGEIEFKFPIPGIPYVSYDDAIIIAKKSEEKSAYGYTNYEYGIINKKGEVILNAEYDFIGKTKNNLYRVSKGSYPDTKYGIIDSDGNIVFDIIYNSISSFDENGYALIVGDSTWFIIDSNANIIF